MDAAAFARALRAMTPERLVVVGDCVHWPESDPPPEAEVLQALQRLQASYAAFTPPAALAMRARAAYEHDYNRRFLIRDLDGVDDDSWTPADSVACAETWAALLRDVLQRQVPDRAFLVEVVGGEGADEEPLEVCVTFSQSTTD